MWDEITYNPFANFNSYSVEVLKWISNFISHFTGNVIIYPCWDKSQSVLVKGTLVWSAGTPNCHIIDGIYCGNSETRLSDANYCYFSVFTESVHYFILNITAFYWYFFFVVVVFFCFFFSFYWYYQNLHFNDAHNLYFAFFWCALYSRSPLLLSLRN